MKGKKLKKPRQLTSKQKIAENEEKNIHKNVKWSNDVYYLDPAKSLKKKCGFLPINLRVRVVRMDVIDAIELYGRPIWVPLRSNVRNGNTLAVINNASHHNKGGGATSNKGGGAKGEGGAQEECLYRGSNLNEIYSTADANMRDNIVVSNNVSAIRNAEGELIKDVQLLFDVIAIAFERLANGTITGEQLENTKNKIKMLIKIISENKTWKIVLLGATGCGAQGWPVSLIANIFKDVIDANRDKDCSRDLQLIFVIKVRGNNSQDETVYTQFCSVFGQVPEMKEDVKR